MEYTSDHPPPPKCIIYTQYSVQVSPRSLTMAAQEVREYRTLSKKLVEIEEKGKMLEKLQKRRVNLNEEELFVQNLQSKFKILGDRRGIKGKQREEVLTITMKYKVRDSTLHGIRVRRRRNYLRSKLEQEMGKRSTEWRKIKEEVMGYTTRLRVKLKVKYSKKVEHMVKKYGVVRNRCDVDKVMLEYMGEPKILVEDVGPDKTRDPVIVENTGETIVLSKDELELLRLGPKYCLFVNLTEENFETDVEEAVMKIKWDLMGDDGKTPPGEEDIAHRIVLGDNECDRIEEEREEEMDIVDAESRAPFCQKK